MPNVEDCNSCKVSSPSADSKVDYKNNQISSTYNDFGMNSYNYNTQPKYERVGSRQANGVMTSEMSYTDYNSIPVGEDVNSLTSDFSYSFLPPDKWYPVPPHPPICVTEQKCPVCPLASSSESLTLKDYFDVGRITPGDVVNTAYVKEKLNSGR